MCSARLLYPASWAGADSSVRLGTQVDSVGQDTSWVKNLESFADRHPLSTPALLQRLSWCGHGTCSPSRQHSSLDENASLLPLQSPAMLSAVLFAFKGILQHFSPSAMTCGKSFGHFSKAVRQSKGKTAEIYSSALSSNVRTFRSGPAEIGTHRRAVDDDV